MTKEEWGMLREMYDKGEYSTQAIYVNNRWVQWAELWFDFNNRLDGIDRQLNLFAPGKVLHKKGELI